MPRELSKEDVQDFRARVGEAAAALYAKGGEAAITMREIARAIGSSPMGLYRYFRDRDEIIAYLRTNAFNTFALTLETAFAEGGNPFSRARAVGRAYLDFALENPGAYRLMFDLSQPDEQRNDELAKASARATRTVTRHVDDLREAGIVTGDSKEIGRALWAAAHGVIVLYLAGRLPKDTNVRDLYFETMRLTFRGARTPSSKIRSLSNPKRSNK
ncbi:MAG TPA: TetR/AcrR family transcriptional regulator [Rhizomicrobium sp.]|nr:TetR/AcrR family transcriptional regulator [Rhizomicrobium sp.]